MFVSIYVAGPPTRNMEREYYDHRRFMGEREIDGVIHASWDVYRDDEMDLCKRAISLLRRDGWDSVKVTEITWDSQGNVIGDRRVA